MRSKVDVQRQGGISDPESTNATTDPRDLHSFEAASRRDRRKDARQQVDNSAEILLVNVGSRLCGRILDLSLGGCRIRTDGNFPVGIYTRVEVEFRIDGLPFRLGGVIQAIHDRKTVGVRFLDLSERKRAQVSELINEVAELRTAGTAEDPATSQ